MIVMVFALIEALTPNYLLNRIARMDSASAVGRRLAYSLSVSFHAIEQRRNDPNQKNRSRDEIEEIFSDRFAVRIIRDGKTQTKEPAKKDKEWRRDRDRDVESAKRATAHQRECS